MAGDEFEGDEAEAGAEGEGGVEEPEGGGGHRLVEAADPADHGVGGEEGEIIEVDDSGVDRFGATLEKRANLTGRDARWRFGSVPLEASPPDAPSREFSLRRSRPVQS